MQDGQTIVQRIATKALIVNELGQILFLREARTYEEGTNIGKYHLPGGRLEPGEAHRDGLEREVKEECGLEIEIGKPFFVGEWRPVIKGAQNQIVAIFFICKPLSTKIRLSEEHDDFKWVRPEDTTMLNIMSPENEVVTAYLENIQ